MDLSLQKLTKALSIRQQINSLERRLSSLFAGGGSAAPTFHKGGFRKRKPLSAATREKPVAARVQWAQRKGTAPLKAPAKKKGGLTSMDRKKLSDAMKARWAARRGSKKKKRIPTGNPGSFKR